MTAFAEGLEAVRPPLDTLTLPPSAFNRLWPDAPVDPVCIGLTLLSEGDVEASKAAAASEAWAMFPRPQDATLRAEVMPDILLRWFVARGTTDPNDGSMPPELWASAPDDVVKEALTVEGAKMIFDALERLRISTSPVLTEADDEEVACLAALVPEATRRMPPWRAARVRRLLGFCLSEVSEYLDPG